MVSTLLRRWLSATGVDSIRLKIETIRNTLVRMCCNPSWVCSQPVIFRLKNHNSMGFNISNSLTSSLSSCWSVHFSLFYSSLCISSYHVWNSAFFSPSQQVPQTALRTSFPSSSSSTWCLSLVFMITPWLSFYLLSPSRLRLRHHRHRSHQALLNINTLSSRS